jgi:hypothetical protein
MEHKPRILNFKNFVLNESLLNEATTIDLHPSELSKILEKDMGAFLKGKMWNKSIEVFFGNEYVNKPGFDPQKDATPISVTSWIGGGQSVDAGNFFKDAWVETDQFCNRAVELTQTGQISDVLSDLAVAAGWAGLSAATVAGIIALGGIAIPSATIASGFVGASGLAGWGVTAVNLTTIGALGVNLAKTFIDNPDVSQDVKTIAKMVANKEETIKLFQSAMQEHSDFEADWGLDNWLSGIDSMPGWNKSKWKQRGSENIGYLFTYWIAYYSYIYLKTKFGAAVAQAIQNYEQQGGKVSLMDTPFVPNQMMVGNASDKLNTASSTVIPTNSQTGAQNVSTSSGSGSNWTKQREINVNDETISKYGF